MLNKKTLLSKNESNKTSDKKHKKILLVDDSRTLSNILGDFLKIKGHECVVVNEGRTALTMLNSEKFDAVLLDLVMPEMNGDEVITRLHNNGKIKDQKIILFTATNVGDKQIDEYIEKGVYSCLRKPVQPDVLLQVLKDD